MLTFATKYKLLKDTPTHKAGMVVRWDGIRPFFYFDVPTTDELALSKADYNGPRFTVEQVQNAEWFKPLDKLRPFIPPFPSAKRISEYVRLDAECRMVDSVDECRAMNALFADEGFQHRLYEFYKAQYEEFHGLSVKG